MKHRFKNLIREEVNTMKKIVAEGWLCGLNRKVPVEIEAAYLADEMAMIRDDVKRAEFRAKLFAARQKTKAPTCEVEAVPMYRGKSSYLLGYSN
jgi:hypothetical protein